MLSAFWQSWPLFQNTYLAGWSIAVLLSLVGIVIVARDQIFVGVAVSQASALGITVGMWLESWWGASATGWYDLDVVASLVGGLFAVAGALITADSSGRWRETRESITGWVFLLGASGSVLLVSHSPHGMEEVHRLMTSTLIGAGSGDVVIFAGMALASAAALLAFREPLMLLLIDGEMAAAVGLRVGLLNYLIYVWIGVAIALSLRVSGMVYTFGLLILPALVARAVSRELRQLLWVSPLVALAATAPAFLVANYYDFPPAHVSVAVLVVTLAVSWLLRPLWTEG